jgi:hypothetical protein
MKEDEVDLGRMIGVVVAAAGAGPTTGVTAENMTTAEIATEEEVIAAVRTRVKEIMIGIKIAIVTRIVTNRITAAKMNGAVKGISLLSKSKIQWIERS